MKKTNVSELLAAIQRKAPTVAEAASNNTPETDAEEFLAPPAQTPITRRRVGRPVQFWMHDEDRSILRELSAWLAGQGVRTSDSLVIRAALRSARTGAEFLQAYHEAARLDGRLKQSSSE